MQATIQFFPETKFIGKKVLMSFAENRTGELWRSFMPARKTIKNQQGTELYSIEIFKDLCFFQQFNPETVFEKWAAVAVSDFGEIPDAMETLTIPGGLYAVFNYKGKGSEVHSTFEYIYNEWLPNADYVLDNRPHFALMGELYKNEDPNSEETLWIPVREK